MTVASKIKQTLSTIKGAQSTLQQYAAYHPDPQAKQTFQQSQKQLQTVIQSLETRIQEIEYEEPQYKGY